MADGSTLLFSAPSSEGRLTWLSFIETSIGMQPVSTPILLAEMRREQQEAGGAIRLQVVASDLAEVQAQLQASHERESRLQGTVGHLEAIVAQLRESITAKDEQLWSIALKLAETPGVAALPAAGTANTAAASSGIATAGAAARAAESSGFRESHPHTSMACRHSLPSTCSSGGLVAQHARTTAAAGPPSPELDDSPEAAPASAPAPAPAVITLFRARTTPAAMPAATPPAAAAQPSMPPLKLGLAAGNPATAAAAATPAAAAAATPTAAAAAAATPNFGLADSTATTPKGSKKKKWLPSLRRNGSSKLTIDGGSSKTLPLGASSKLPLTARPDMNAVSAAASASLHPSGAQTERAGTPVVTHEPPAPVAEAAGLAHLRTTSMGGDESHAALAAQRLASAGFGTAAPPRLAEAGGPRTCRSDQRLSVSSGPSSALDSSPHSKRPLSGADAGACASTEVSSAKKAGGSVRTGRRWSEPTMALTASMLASLEESAKQHAPKEGGAAALAIPPLQKGREQMGGSHPGGSHPGGSQAGGSQAHRPEGLEYGLRGPQTANLIKQGMLTKLSKGGFTPNWNRRAFALCGSSLFYAKDADELLKKPKLFAEVLGCECHSWAENVTNFSNTLAIRLPPEDKEDPPEMLIIAADTAREKFAWIEAITRGSRQAPCRAEWVGDLLRAPEPSGWVTQHLGSHRSRGYTAGSSNEPQLTRPRVGGEGSAHGGRQYADRDELDRSHDRERSRHRHHRDRDHRGDRRPAANATSEEELPWFSIEKWLPFVRNV